MVSSDVKSFIQEIRGMLSHNIRFNNRATNGVGFFNCHCLLLLNPVSEEGEALEKENTYIPALIHRFPWESHVN